MKNKMFVVHIRILQRQWHYTIGQELYIPVVACNTYRAREKFESIHWGSEYPAYMVLDVYESDNKGLFGIHAERYKDKFIPKDIIEYLISQV